MKEALARTRSGDQPAGWMRQRLAKWSREVRLRLRRDALKYGSELAFWEDWWRRCGGRFPTAHYRRILLAMAGQPDDAFLRDRVVADFGCGPAGSLGWATCARQRIGIDVLAEVYRRFGIADHDMVYVRCTERSIPLSTASVDVLFTLNALDHVSHLRPMCRELIRILAPGGSFFGSFNLHEPRAECEPQTLSESVLRRELLRHLQVDWYAFAPKLPDEPYEPFLRGDVQPVAPPGPAILWVRASKPAG